jgi:hypothetical protein
VDQVKVSEIGLHNNCEGCPHPINGKDCPYVVNPRRRRFPCYFKVNIPAKISLPDIPKPLVPNAHQAPSGAHGFGATISAAIHQHRAAGRDEDMLIGEKRGRGRPRKGE